MMLSILSASSICWTRDSFVTLDYLKLDHSSPRFHTIAKDRAFLVFCAFRQTLGMELISELDFDYIIVQPHISSPALTLRVMNIPYIQCSYEETIRAIKIASVAEAVQISRLKVESVGSEVHVFLTSRSGLIIETPSYTLLLKQ
ncbi:hypothetical protein DL89DRAFT_105210 [Linderina pennispora]|uniref:Uncharacterized protein n=1 Tax=Linderina pennispora TaxID=61395 RepID=A0A1Y1WF19_9FUNG|nr:uncharacterized protein DL89DRAFT_105210 [Linderina pennispora]ORX71985.1 hypothetical protein DL89DRAFT_105210 [Linderina pennispora]